MSDEPVWTPDEDPRYQRMEAANKLMGDLSLPFSSVEDFEELIHQSSMLSCLHNMLTLHSTSMVYNLLEAMRQVLPPAYKDQVIRRYRILLASAVQRAVEGRGVPGMEAGR